MWFQTIFILLILCLQKTDSVLLLLAQKLAGSASGSITPQSTFPTNNFVPIPPMVANAFTTAFINDVVQWGNIDDIFSTSSVSTPEAYVFYFNFVYSHGIKYGVDPSRALAGAKFFAKAIEDTWGHLNAFQLAQVYGKTAAQMLLYGKVLNVSNVSSLAQELSDSIQNAFKETQPPNLNGIAEGYVQFLNSYNLYAPAPFDVKKEYFVLNLYYTSGVPRTS